ncbi:hypothetical protein HPY86_08680 [candidate division WOR-3 bacterium]|nr:hypothetical protein [candidate division WOR-3 bacterium]
MSKNQKEQENRKRIGQKPESVSPVVRHGQATLPPRELKRAERFHGHLGPWLVLGLRAGRCARKMLNGSPFDLRAVVECPAKPPVSCFIDGVQLGSGCTMGKSNIQHRVRPGGCRVVFEHRDTAEKVSFKVRGEVFETLIKIKKNEAIARAHQVSQKPFVQLFISEKEEDSKR